MVSMGTEMQKSTVRVTNIPQTVTAKDLLHFLESQLGSDSVFALEIATDRNNWKPRTYGRVQFASMEIKSNAHLLSLSKKFLFKSHNLQISDAYDDIIPRPIDAHNRIDNGVLHVGFMANENRLCALERWEGVRVWVMPERRRLEFWIWQNGECYKLELKFDHVLNAVGCRLRGASESNALLLKS